MIRQFLEKRQEGLEVVGAGDQCPTWKCRDYENGVAMISTCLVVESE